MNNLFLILGITKATVYSDVESTGSVQEQFLPSNVLIVP